MKKFSLLACLMTVTAGMAVAQSTVSIPFFADAGSIVGLVGLQNVGAGSIVVTASYLDNTGANGASGGTFTLAPGQGMSYRPGTIGATEVQPAGLVDAPYPNGSITFLIPGGGEVAGRYLQIQGSNSFAHNLEVQ